MRFVFEFSIVLADDTPGMSLDEAVKSRLEEVLRLPAGGGTPGPRLVDDAHRLWKTIQRFTQMGLSAGELDAEALELACFALHLPFAHRRGATASKLGRLNLRQRCQQGSELIINLLSGQAPQATFDRVVHILEQTPARSPTLTEAKLLADAINLEDFGILGLVGQIIQLSASGQGTIQLLESWDNRQSYGYWEARLKDSFHFGPVRDLAETRLHDARLVVRMLRAELPDGGGETGAS
jgi:hypothetical protein